MRTKAMAAVFIASSMILAPSAWADDTNDDSTSEIEYEYSVDDISDDVNDDVSGPDDDVDDDSIDDSQDNVSDDSDTINDDLVDGSKDLSVDEDLPDADRLYEGSAWVVATNGTDKKVWVVKVAKNGKVSLVVPSEYSNWNISINYRLKKKYADGKRVFSRNVN